MAYTIPNEATASFPQQAELHSADLAILEAALEGTGVASGCAVTAQGSPDLTVAVAAGSVTIAAATVAVAGGNSAAVSPDATNPRYVLVEITGAGAIALNAGTAAANPDKPAPTAGRVVLAELWVPANLAAITSAHIVDKRAKTATYQPLAARLTTLAGRTDATEAAALQSAALDGVYETVVVHGVDATVARPAGAIAVRWIGTVLPNNIGVNDLWIDPSRSPLGVIAETHTLVTATLAAETDLFSLVIPAGRLAIGDVVDIWATGDELQNNGGADITKTPKLKIGGTTATFVAGAYANQATRRKWRFDGRLVVSGASSQEVGGYFAMSGAGSDDFIAPAATLHRAGSKSCAEPIASSITVALSVTLSAAHASSDVRCRGAALIHHRFS